MLPSGATKLSGVSGSEEPSLSELSPELELFGVFEELLDGVDVLFDAEEFSESVWLVEPLCVSELSCRSLFVQAVSKSAEIKKIAEIFFMVFPFINFMLKRSDVFYYNI